MGSIDLETANMYSDEEDDIPQIADDMPPLSPTRGNEPMTNGGETGPFDDIPQGADGENGEGGEGRPRRMVHRKPIPKLDPVRLTSDRGLPTILNHFEKIKFKGKGHEVSDLNTLMMTMEHWGNRLFPKMTFDEIIERIEKLGRKKPVQVCLRKIRMDMPLLDEDFVEREEDDDVIRGETEETNEDEQLPDLPNATTTPGNVSYGTLDITDDQKQRMEENKRKAMEKRAARMQQQQSSQNTTGILANELPDDSQTKIDSDEEDLENEMWNDLISSQQTSTQRPQSNSDNKNNSKKSAIVDLDSEELDISRSQVQKPVEHCPEYDDETDDDDDYEEYLAKLKGSKEMGSVVMDKTDTASSQTVEDEQSLSILKEDVACDNVAMVTGGNEMDEEEQSQSILGDDVDSQSSYKKVDKSTIEEETGSGQSAKGNDATQDSSEKAEVKQSQGEKTENLDVVEDDDATCLPEEDTQVGEAGPTLEDEEATCLLPEEYSEECAEGNIADLETQLLEEDTAVMETQAMDIPADTAEADTVAMGTQEVKDAHVDSAEAETMEYEAMDTAEAETQALK
ncbi:uncharacterized protein [Amphiura filiformis]|uniref:uncharacterized protein n=1 Tax=Amphiura filiformis TaxID=82378 RepID=UPI003B21647E